MTNIELKVGTRFIVNGREFVVERLALDGSIEKPYHGYIEYHMLLSLKTREQEPAIIITEVNPSDKERTTTHV